MGCDIHAVIQRKDSEGSWITQREKNPEFGKYDWEPEFGSTVSISRDYDLFAILANVRNGYGFAGCDTGDGFEPMTCDRGLPKGVVLDNENCFDGIWLGDHSYSWVTLSEIDAYDWDRVTKRRGWINLTEYKMMLEKGEDRPSRWSGGISGPGIQHITIQEAKRKVQSSIRLFEDQTYFVYEWEITYREVAQDFFEDVVSQMRKLGKPEDVRLVMGFDS